MAQLLLIAEDKSEPTPVRLAAIRDALDRAGLGAKQQIEIDAKVETWEHKAEAAVVDWGELAELMPPADPNVIDAEVVDDYAPQNLTLHDSERPNPHREQRMAEIEAELSRLPAVPEPTPPWLSEESGADTATRRADEHRKRAFAAEKASKGLSPRTTRPRQ